LVLPTTAYDLQADSSWVADSDTNEFSVSPVVEVEVLFALFWSAPMGQGFSGAFNITMELDGQPYFLSTMFGASQGQNYMTVTQPWIATSGFHYYFWEIDPDNWVDEFNENNNSIMDGFEVVTGGGVRWGNDQMGFLPEESRISGVYPNPFNPTVTLRYEISQPGMIRLVIYDANGREVIKLFDGFAPLGAREVSWEAKGISSGTYFAVLEAGGKRSVKPLLFVK
jgi:hypothetical protein